MYLGTIGMCLSCSRRVATLRADAGDTGLGIVLIYQTTTVMPGAIWFGLPYLSLSLSLNVVLTLMIVVRLVLHGKNVRAATGSPAGISGLYKTIATMLIESSALFAVTSMLAAGPQSSVMSNIFMPALAVTQVRVPPRSQSSDRLPNVMTDCTGDRSTAHHSTSRQQECIDERLHRPREYKFFQSQDPRGADGRQQCPSWWGHHGFCG